MAIKVGDKLPAASFKVVTSDGLADVDLATLTGGKKVVIFAVPGAFTPTCHAKHVPSFLNNLDAIKSKGVDAVACISVNDPFVLDAWGKANDVGDRITMLSDGNAAFTKQIGLDFDGSMANLGTRSKRYAMIVDDGTVRWLAVEEAPPMMDVSGGEQVLAAL